MNKAKGKIDWPAIDAKILASIDVATEAESLGLIFAAGKASRTGWTPVHAIDRDDDNPSACICVDRQSKAYGRYKDHADSAKSIGFFNLAAELGKFADWQEARAHFGRRAGIELPKKGRSKGKQRAAASDSASLLDSIVIRDNADLLEYGLAVWTERKPPIMPEAAMRAGAKYCCFPAKSKQFSCIALFGYLPSDWKNPAAVILYKLDGSEFDAHKGLPKRKAHLVRGSQDALILVGTPDELAAAHTVLKCEGPPDALAIAPHLPAGWIACTNACGANSFSDELAEAFRGKRLFVCGDADNAGRDGVGVVGAYSLGIASEVRDLRLPYAVEQSHGKDLRDYVRDGGSVAELIAAAEAGAAMTEADIPEKIRQNVAADKRANSSTRTAADGERTDNDDDGRPEIEVTADEHLVNDEAISALARDQTLFQRAGMLVRVIRPPAETTEGGVRRPAMAPRIAAIQSATLREMLSANARFVKMVGAEDEAYLKRVHPPGFCVDAIAARGSWPGIRQLEAIVSSPTLRPDGTVLDEPGYDPQTALLYEPTADFPAVPKSPSRADAIRAREEVLEAVADFPFERDEHKSSWLAFLLTVLARHAFEGPAPMFLVDANAAGSGKTLLCRVASLIATGRDLAVMTNSADDNETRKTITSLALCGDLLVMIDNIGSTFGCPSLDAALTATAWKDRILGRSEQVELPLLMTWCASGNNVALMGDTSRRTCHIRLLSQVEKPEERDDFRQPKLRQWVLENRPRLLVAALTVLQAYFAAGRPSMGLPKWGSFEGWSDLVRQAVVWVEMVDPGAAREELTNHADRDLVALRSLIAGWRILD